MSNHTREIRQHWLIEGILTLVTPTHLSNGDTAYDVDMPLLLDPLAKRPLLTGASLAGALRNYLNESMDGYVELALVNGQAVIEETKNSPAQLLFGAFRRDNEGEQSPLIVHDALGISPENHPFELRDGVRIDPKTRTAADKAKFDLQLLAAGTTFNIAFELIITQDMLNDKECLPEMKKALAVVLNGLQKRHIHLGGRKNRGYGECAVTGWRLRQFDLTQKTDLTAWLAYGREWADDDPKWQSGNDIAQLLGETIGERESRDQFQISANFAIDGSILIRSGFETEFGPDMAHLESRRGQEIVPILSGTSLAGVMRSQALRIAHTISGNEATATNFVRNLFGYMPVEGEDDAATRVASRVLVKETEITGNYKRLVQSRVAIDRFSGGALESALFTEQPIFGGETVLTLHVKRASDAEKGLLLLVLKDLWAGMIAVGGEASVGRGRLKGLTATIIDGTTTWQLGHPGQPFVAKDDAVALQGFVNALHEQLKGGAK